MLQRRWLIKGIWIWSTGGMLMTGINWPSTFHTEREKLQFVLT